MGLLEVLSFGKFTKKLLRKSTVWNICLEWTRSGSMMIPETTPILSHL